MPCQPFFMLHICNTCQKKTPCEIRQNTGGSKGDLKKGVNHSEIPVIDYYNSAEDVGNKC